jgi:hypothetical protein
MSAASWFAAHSQTGAGESHFSLSMNATSGPIRDNDLSTKRPPDSSTLRAHANASEQPLMTSTTARQGVF